MYSQAEEQSKPNPVLFGILTQDQVSQVMNKSPVLLLSSNTSFDSSNMAPDIGLAMASSEVGVAVLSSTSRI